VTRKWGWRPQPPDSRDVHLGAQFLRPGAAPDAFELPKPAIRDQKSTGSCTGQGTTNAEWIAYHQQGANCPPLSALAAYSWGRALEGGGAERRDDGAYIRNVVKALQKLGAADESAWPFDESKVNEHPDATATWSAFDRKGIRGYYAIPMVTPAILRAAISSGFPVVAGWQLGEGFENYDGRGVLGREGLGRLGGHCVCIRAYKPGVWTLVNSWGTGYGLNGEVLANDDFVTAATDAWAIDVRPS
jgi:Papain family cysteine protease